MKVCLVSYEFPPHGGGEGNYTESLARGLRERGVEVALCIPRFDPPDEVPRKYDVLAVDSGSWPFGVRTFMRNAGRALPGFVKEHAVDIVHVTFDYPTGALPLKSIGRPVVATVHHLHSDEGDSAATARAGKRSSLRGFVKEKILTRYERILLSGSAAVVAVSKATGGSLVRRKLASAEKVKVIQGGIDVTPFAQARDTAGFKTSRGLGEDPLILYVGRLTPSKGLETLIEAFPQVLFTVPSARLLLVGEGAKPYSSFLKAKSASLGMEGRISFLGRISTEELLDAYAAASVVVLPSFMEGLPLTVMEAMASGKYVVASNVGGIPELIRGGIDGSLVPPGDPQALSNAITWSLSNPEDSARMALLAKERANREFSIERMVDDTLELYSQVITSMKLRPSQGETMKQGKS